MTNTIPSVDATSAAAAARVAKPAVTALLAAMAEAEVLREEINAVADAFLAERVYLSRYSKHPRGYTPRITKQEDAWKLRDADSDAYNAHMAAHIAANYDVPKDHCPALIAEYNVRQLEVALIEAVQVLPEFADVTDWVLTRASVKTDRRRKYIDTFIKLVVNFPG